MISQSTGQDGEEVGRCILRIHNEGSLRMHRCIIGAFSGSTMKAHLLHNRDSLSLCYAAKRQRAAQVLVPFIVDPENAPTHLLPILACAL